MVKFALGYLLVYKRLAVCVAVCSVLTAATGLVVPYLLGRYVDSVASHHNIEWVMKFTIAILAIYCFELVVSYWAQLCGAKLRTRAGYDLNRFVIRHLQRLPFLYFNNKNISYLSQRVNNDANTIVMFVQDNAVNVFVKSATFIAVVLLLFSLNALLTLVLLPVIPLYAVQYRCFRKPLYKTNYALKEQQNFFFAELNDQLTNMKFIKFNVLFDRLNRKMDGKFVSLLEWVIKSVRCAFAFQTGGTITSHIAMLILFLVGGIQIIEGKLTIGDFIIFNSYFGMMLACASYYLTVGQEYQNSKVSYDRIAEILTSELEQNGERVINGIDFVEMKNISFGYVKGSVALEVGSARFEKGKIYCVSGENGSGKSTFVALLLGLYQGAFSGDVTYNGINISELDMYDVRKRLIGISEQEPVLLADSVQNNLCAGSAERDAGYSLETCVYAELMKLDYFIDRQTTKEDLQSCDSAMNLSGGEKQKISQIRTLLKKPRLLVLDEPTSALDKESVTALKKILINEKQGRITIIVTHHGEFAEIADHFIQL